jgi:hypothetical protein
MIRTKIDTTGEAVKIADDGLVKLDGITAFRRVLRDGVIMIQFYDRDRQRSTCRGTPFVEIPLVVLVAMMEIQERADEPG